MSEMKVCILFGLGLIVLVPGLCLLVGWLATPYVVKDIVETVRASGEYRDKAQSEWFLTLTGTKVPEPKREPANTEAGNRREICEFLRERGVKRALIDGEQYYFCENIDNG